MTGPRLDGRIPHRILKGDRVKTKSGRTGRVLKFTRDGEEAVVAWDDGENFSIRAVHLELVEV